MGLNLYLFEHTRLIGPNSRLICSVYAQLNIAQYSFQWSIAHRFQTDQSILPSMFSKNGRTCRLCEG